MVADNYKKVAHEALALLNGPDAGTDLARLCRFLRDAVGHFDWVGFYIAVPEERLLVLGPFEGEPTDHVRIPYGRGVCGQSADREERVLVQDVTGESNYLACSVSTKSELVVPVMRDGAYVGQIDIDSHRVNAFSPDDEWLLDTIAERSAPLVNELSLALRKEP